MFFIHNVNSLLSVICKQNIPKLSHILFCEVIRYPAVNLLYTKIVYRNNSFSARFFCLGNVQLSTLWIINALKTKILPLECSLSSSPVPVIISSPLLNNLISERRLIDVSSRLLLPQSRKCLINSLKDKNGNRRSHYRTNSLSLLFSFSLTIAFHPFISQELSNKR